MSPKPCKPVLGVMLLCAVSASFAQTPSSERGPDPYETKPACLERGQLKPGQRDPCEQKSPDGDRNGARRAPPAASGTAGASVSSGGAAAGASASTGGNAQGRR